MKEIAKEIAKSSGVPHEEEPPSKVAKKEFEEHPSKVPRRGEPTSPTRSALSSTPHCEGGIQTVCLDGEEEVEVEVDEVPLEHPDDWGDFEDDDFEEESEDAGPPQLCPEELEELEKEADETELNRLLKMEVLIPADPNNLDGYRFLTTKSVYDWRWRMLEETGKFGWKRRSRLVGRDYKFMSPEMENLFSSTSNAVGTKLWVALAQSSGGELELWSVDVEDAYLMAPQEGRKSMWSTTATSSCLGDAFLDKELVRKLGMSIWARSSLRSVD